MGTMRRPKRCRPNRSSNGQVTRLRGQHKSASRSATNPTRHKSTPLVPRPWKASWKTQHDVDVRIRCHDQMQDVARASSMVGKGFRPRPIISSHTVENSVKNTMVSKTSRATATKQGESLFSAYSNTLVTRAMRSQLCTFVLPLPCALCPLHGHSVR